MRRRVLGVGLNLCLHFGLPDFESSFAAGALVGCNLAALG